MTEETKTDNELIPLKKLENPLQIFTESEMDKLIDEIKKQTDAFVPDLASDKSRKEIAAMAYKVSRSKTALVKLSNDLTEGWKQKTKAVVDVRMKMCDRMDALRDEVRKPLTDWEDAQEKRIAQFKEKLADIQKNGETILAFWEDFSADSLKTELKNLENIEIGDDWDEWKDKAAEVKSIALEKINIAIQKREIHDKEQAELKAFREAEAKHQEEEEQKRAEEAEKAAQAERDRIAVENETRIEQERAEASEKAKRKAEQIAEQVAGEKAEIQRQKDIEIEQERKAYAEAQEKGKRDAENAKIAADEAAKKAAADERQKIKDEENQRLADEKRREENKEHQRKINQEAVDGLVKAGIQKPVAQAAVKAIILGEVPHVKLSY